jgi:predicted nuclease with TOPRIM domain
VRAFNQFYTDHTALAEDYEAIIAALTDTEKLEKQAAELGSEIEELLELMQKMINENASTAQDQKQYNKKYNGLLSRYEAAQSKLDGVNNERMLRSAKREKMRQFFADLAERHSTITEFDENLWYAMIESVTVSELTAVFTFKSGATVEVSIFKDED